MADIPIVFAPGTLCDARLFAPQVSAFGSRASVADLTIDDTLKNMGRRLLQNAPERFFLAGLSLGGILMFEVWRQQPDRICGMALLNASPYADAPERRPVRLAQIAKAETGNFQTLVEDDLFPNYLGSRTSHRIAIKKTVIDMAMDLGADIFALQSMAAMDRGSSLETLPTISCPTTIIGGGEDKMCPPDMQTFMQDRISDSSLHILKRCGHLSALEFPERVTQILIDAVDAV